MLPRFTPMVNMKRLKSRWFRQNKAKNSAEMLKMYGGSSNLCMAEAVICTIEPPEPAI
jgi:hypothetical protein